MLYTDLFWTNEEYGSLFSERAPPLVEQVGILRPDDLQVVAQFLKYFYVDWSVRKTQYCSALNAFLVIM